MACAASVSSAVHWLRMMSDAKIYRGASEICSLLCDSGRRPSEAPGTLCYALLRVVDFQSVRETHFLFSFSSLLITRYPPSSRLSWGLTSSELQSGLRMVVSS